MDYQLIDSQLQELQSSVNVQSVKQISDSSYLISYAPQLSHSPYSNILFSLKIAFSEQFPENPPALAFQDKIYHLNVDPSSGRVNMPILREDWSPFLTISDVFNSLNALLEEPEIEYAANDTIKNQYINEPEKYMRKVAQLANLYTQPKGNDNHSQVEHVEEIVEFREDHNHSFEKEKERPEIANLKESLPFSEIPKNSKESLDTPEKNEIRIEDYSGEEHLEIKVNSQKEVQQPKKEALKFASKKSPKKSDKQLLKMTESFVCEEKQQFQQIQASLKKSDQLIEVLLLSCESMQQTLEASKNARIRQLLEKRLQSQWKMVEQLLEMTSKLKQKLFTTLKNETNQLLK